MGVPTTWSAERNPALWRTFAAWRHWRRLSTHTTCVWTDAPAAPSRAATLRRVASQSGC